MLCKESVTRPASVDVLGAQRTPNELKPCHSQAVWLELLQGSQDKPPLSSGHISDCQKQSMLGARPNTQQYLTLRCYYALIQTLGRSNFLEAHQDSLTLFLQTEKPMSCIASEAAREVKAALCWLATFFCEGHKKSLGLLFVYVYVVRSNTLGIHYMCVTLCFIYVSYYKCCISYRYECA